MPVTLRVGTTNKAPKQVFGNVTGTYRRLHMGWANVLGVWRIAWQEEVVANVTSTASGAILRSYFDAADWANPLVLKRAIVPLGNEVGTANATYAIAPTTAGDPAGSWAGTLVLDIYGTVSGIGGAANSGQGGSVIWGDLPGRNGEKMIVNNYGTVRAGGGGGGRGGAGGTGLYYTTGDSGWIFLNSPSQTSWVITGGANVEISWYQSIIVSGLSASNTSYSAGGYTYYMGDRVGFNGYSDYRYVKRTWQVPNYTTGGAGGNGGRGQGYDGSWAYGASGASGGQNAGAGGAGGQGGGFGASGNTGIAGGYGNYSGNGAAGTAGGLPGYYLHGSANVIFNNFGTVLGLIA